jgi:hypothetical protein
MAGSTALLVLAVAGLASLARASGCFGGHPGALPRNGAAGAPVNTHVRVSGPSAATVVWEGPDGRQIRFREWKVGTSGSFARVFAAESMLAQGAHTIRMKDPDVTQTFDVGRSMDVSPPRMQGTLSLDAVNQLEPGSECPVNRYIRASFPAPADEGGSASDFSYLVWLGDRPGEPWHSADALVHAEAVERAAVRIRFGEAGCGCIPHVRLTPGVTYRLMIRAMDVAGNISRESLSGAVAIPR